MLVLPAIAVVLLALLPVGYLIVRSAEAGWSGITDVAGRRSTLSLLTNSLGLAAAVTFCATVIGVALAWLTVRVRLPGRPLWRVLAALPLAVPTYVAALTWIAPFPGIAGWPGAFIVLTLYSYPYVYLPVAAALTRLDPGLEDVARALGTGPWRTFRTVTLPGVRPAVINGALLVALYALSDFGAVSIMRFDALTQGIYVSYQAGFDRTPAAVLGLVLVVCTALVLLAEGVHGRRRIGVGVGVGVGTGIVRGTSLITRPLARVVGVATCSTVAVVTLGLPALVLGRWAAEGFSSADFADDVWRAGRNSFVAGALGAAVTTLAALPIGLLAGRYRSKLSTSLQRASYIGHALPGIVVALALVFVTARFAPVIYQRLPALAVAYLVLFLPLAVAAIHSSASQSPPALEEVARSLGHRPFSVLTRVTVPLTIPGVTAALVLTFLTVVKELPATLMLRPTGFDTLATRVWTETGVAAYAAAAPSAIALVVVAAVPTYLLSIRGRAPA